MAECCVCCAIRHMPARMCSVDTEAARASRPPASCTIQFAPGRLADWQVNLLNQHPGYITWEEYLANQQRLAQNQTNDCPGAPGSAAREGRSEERRVGKE